MAWRKVNICFRIPFSVSLQALLSQILYLLWQNYTLQRNWPFCSKNVSMLGTVSNLSLIFNVQTNVFRRYTNQVHTLFFQDYHPQTNFLLHRNFKKLQRCALFAAWTETLNITTKTSLTKLLACMPYCSTRGHFGGCFVCILLATCLCLTVVTLDF